MAPRWPPNSPERLRKLQVDRRSRRFWLVAGTLAVLALPAGIGLSAAVPDLDMQALLLFGALLAAAFAGIQAHRARLSSLMPLLVVHEATFTTLGYPATAAGVQLVDRRRDIGLQVALQNVGVGPAIDGDFQAWLEQLPAGDTTVHPDSHPDDEQLEAIRALPPHFRGSVAAVAAGEPNTIPWLPTGAYEGGPAGPFRATWRLTYGDVFGKRYVIDGWVFFESPFERAGYISVPRDALPGSGEPS